MIAVTYNKDKKRGEISNSSRAFFSEVNEDLYQHGFIFDKKDKVWVGHPIKVKEVLPILRGYERVLISREDAKSLDDASMPKGPKRVRRKYRPELLKAPPLGEYQVQAIKRAITYPGYILAMDLGTGKCLKKDTPIIMADGSIKKVQDIKNGESVMGPDSKPRIVSGVTTGREMMYRIVPKKGSEPFECNESHILYLERKKRKTINGKRVWVSERITLSVKEYLALNKTEQNLCKLVRSSLFFPKKELPFDPYLYGFWLGDGTRNLPQITIGHKARESVSYLKQITEEAGLIWSKYKNYSGTGANQYSITSPIGESNPFRRFIQNSSIKKEKFIFQDYLTSSREDRMELLAGIIDADGYLEQSGGNYEITQKSERLKNNILFLARGLGFRATWKKVTKRINPIGFEGEYYRIFIGGMIDEIPLRVTYKKAKSYQGNKNPLLSGFEVTPLGVGEYYGFAVDKDHLFLLGDTTITHNTYCTISSLNHLWADGEVDKVVIVSVASTLYNWKKELLQFSDVQEEDIEIVTSTNKEPFDLNKRILIFSYSSFRTISKYWTKKVTKKDTSKPRIGRLPLSDWSGGKGMAIVIDECHVAKNMSSQITNFLHIHKNHFKQKYLLSGTLTPNEFWEIYSPIAFIDKDIFHGYSKTEFEEDLCKMGTRFSRYQKAGYKPGKIEYYTRLSDPYIFRIDKREALGDQLTELNIKKIYLPLNKKQLSIYKEVIRKTVEDSQTDSGAVSTTKFINSFPILLQVLADPSMLEGKYDLLTETRLGITDWKFKDNSKLEYCSDLIEEHSDDKIIIWGDNPKVLNNLGLYYQKFNPIVIHGQNTPSGRKDGEWREEQLTAFRTKKEHRLLIANPAVLGTGVNIFEANVCIYWNLSFNYADYYQAMGRVDRKGQEKDVYVYLLMAHKTLDEVAYASNQRKMKLNDLKKEKQNLSMDDILKLVTGDM